MAKSNGLRKVKPGDKITAELWNALIDEIRARTISAAAPIKAVRGPGGTTIALGHVHEPMLYELTADLDAGSSANAKRKIFNSTDPTSGSWVDDPNSSTEKVYDSIGSLSGKTGNLMWVIFSRISGRLEIIQIHC